MLKLLIKKEIFETFRSYFYDPKKNKMRTKTQTIIHFAMFIGIMFIMLGGMFSGLAISLCEPLVELDLDYIYFLIMSLIAILLGVFGTVFNTFSSLYLGKDNDLLLSMPIPVSNIVFARLVNVFVMDLLYSGVVSVPMIVIYFVFGRFNINAIVGCLVLFIIISLFVLMLSCILGFFVAKLSIRLKNKSYITVLITLACLGTYYYVYFKALPLLEEVVNNALIYGEQIGKAYPLYLFGTIGSGNYSAMVIYLSIILILCFVVWKVLEKTFLNLAISTTNEKKKEYKTNNIKQNTVFISLVKKEFNRFTSSANYMLNCGLGIVFMLVAAVVILFKSHDLLFMIESVLIDDFSIVFVGIFGAVLMFSFMIDIIVPNISLEGKNLWINRSLPVSTWNIFLSKMALNAICIAIPLTLLSAVLIIVFNSLGNELYFVIISNYLSIIFTTLFGMFLSIEMPILNWSNEIYPIKQSGNVFIFVMLGMIVPAAIICLYIFVFNNISSIIYIGVIDVIMSLISLILVIWLKNKGTKLYEKL